MCVEKFHCLPSEFLRKATNEEVMLLQAYFTVRHEDEEYERNKKPK